MLKEPLFKYFKTFKLCYFIRSLKLCLFTRLISRIIKSLLTKKDVKCLPYSFYTYNNQF